MNPGTSDGSLVVILTGVGVLLSAFALRRTPKDGRNRSQFEPGISKRTEEQPEKRTQGPMPKATRDSSAQFKPAE